jgi:hypothetical protein
VAAGAGALLDLLCDRLKDAGRSDKKLADHPADAFLYRLCGHLGIINVEEIKETLTQRQILKWMAHYRLDGGFGQEWVRSARMASLIVAALTGKHEPMNELRWSAGYQEGDEFLGKHRREKLEAEQTKMLDDLLARLKGNKPDGSN